MFEFRSLLNLVLDLAFIAAWGTVYGRVVPNGGFRRIAGIVGWISALAAYVQISTSIFVRWGASSHFENVWSMPLDALDKVGALTFVISVVLIVLANRGIERRVTMPN